MVAAPIRCLDLFDEPIAAPEERILLGRKRAAGLALPIQPSDLIHRPPEPPTQAGHDVFQFVDKALHVLPQRRRVNDIRVNLGPALLEHDLHGSRQVVHMAVDQVTQGGEVEGRDPNRAPLEEIRLHTAGQASSQRVVDRVPFALCQPGISDVPVQLGDHRGVNVLADHDVVAQVERGRVDPSG